MIARDTQILTLELRQVYGVDLLAQFGAPQDLTKVIRLEIFHKVLKRSPSVSTSKDEGTNTDDLASEFETDQTRHEIRTKTTGEGYSCY